MKQSVIITLVCIISLIHYSVAEWNDANWSDFPFMVSLRTGGHFCGGSIITLNGHNGKGAILTAAHCTGPGTSTLVSIGCTSTSCPSSESPSTYSVESVLNHPEWDGSVGTGDDIAILYLTSAITHSGAEAVVLEPDVDVIQNDDEVVLVGYGGAHASDTDTLETAITHIHDEGAHLCEEDNGIVCVLDDGGSDNLVSTLCFGDSGSPMMRNGKQIGIVSFGFNQCSLMSHQGGALVPVYYNWIIEEVNNWFQIKLLDRDGCIDVFGGQEASGTNVILWGCHQRDNQLWRWDGKKLVSKDSNKCLDVFGGGTARGTNLILWDCHGNSNQLWDVDNDDHLIIGEGSNRCIDVFGGNDSPGTNLIIWDCHANWNQQWVLQFVSTSSISIFGLDLLSLVYFTDEAGNVTYQVPITLMAVYMVMLVVAVCLCYFNASRVLRKRRKQTAKAKYNKVPVTSADEDDMLIN